MSLKFLFIDRMSFIVNNTNNPLCCSCAVSVCVCLRLISCSSCMWLKTQRVIRSCVLQQHPPNSQGDPKQVPLPQVT